jgi:hypothetical protein
MMIWVESIELSIAEDSEDPWEEDELALSCRSGQLHEHNNEPAPRDQCGTKVTTLKSRRNTASSIERIHIKSIFFRSMVPIDMLGTISLAQCELVDACAHVQAVTEGIFEPFSSPSEYAPEYIIHDGSKNRSTRGARRAFVWKSVRESERSDGTKYLSTTRT